MELKVEDATITGREGALRYTVTDCEVRLKVELAGEYDAHSGPHVRELVLRHIVPGHQTVIFDCARMRFGGSQFVGLLITLGKDLGCKVALRGIPRSVQRVIDCCGIEHMFEFEPHALGGNRF